MSRRTAFEINESTLTVHGVHAIVSIRSLHDASKLDNLRHVVGGIQCFRKRGGLHLIFCVEVSERNSSWWVRRIPVTTPFMNAFNIVLSSS